MGVSAILPTFGLMVFFGILFLLTGIALLIIRLSPSKPLRVLPIVFLSIGIGINLPLALGIVYIMLMPYINKL